MEIRYSFSVTIVFSLLLASCNFMEPESKQSAALFSDFFKLKQTIPIQGKNMSSALLSGAFVRDSLLLLSDMQTRSIFKINLFDNSCNKLGTNGVGPGEYTMPFHLYAKDATVYFSDITNSRICKVDQNCDYISQIKAPHGATRFIELKKQIYFLTSPSSTYYVVSQNGDKFFRTPRVYKNLKRSPALPGIIEINNSIYFMNPYEKKIFKLNTGSNTEETIKIQGLSHNTNIESLYNSQMDPIKLKKLLDEEERIFCFDAKEINGKYYFLLIPAPNDKNARVIYIVSLHGKLKWVLDMGKLAYIPNPDVKKITLFSTDEETGDITIFIYSSHLIPAEKMQL